MGPRKFDAYCFSTSIESGNSLWIIVMMELPSCNISLWERKFTVSWMSFGDVRLICYRANLWWNIWGMSLNLKFTPLAIVWAESPQ